jgi:hypothetical protein
MKRGQSGQTLIMFAVVLSLLLVGLLALIADLGTLFVAYTHAEDVALLAAQAGASRIDQNAFYNGQLVLDPAASGQACQAAVQAGNLPQPRFSCTPDATRTRITVNIQFNAQLPLPIPAVNVPVKVTETATTVYGDTQGRLAPP